MIDLDELARLAAEATPGPWERKSLAVESPSADVLVAEVVGVLTDPKATADAAFIAACDPATVAALVRAVRAAQVVQFAHSPLSRHQSVSWTALNEALAAFRGPA